MKKPILLALALVGIQSSAYAADLLEVYQQALTSDPTYQQAISTRLSTREGVPIMIAQLLPTITLAVTPSVTRTGESGSAVQSSFPLPRNITTRANTMTLSLTQTVFNYAEFAQVAEQLSLAKGADAILNSALQNLMTRVATAYFAVLQDEENLRSNEANKLSFAEQLDQVKQQYQVGLKTVTDMYTAQASYDSSVAQYIAAQTQLQNDKEVLRAIAGKYYSKLSRLSDDFPLISPKPQDVEQWVRKAQQQNWSVISARYNVDYARGVIHQEAGGHLPSLQLQGTVDRRYSDIDNPYISPFDTNGPSAQTDRAIALNLIVPIFAGGGVVASTNKAVYDYQTAQQALELSVRNTINATRQSYNSIVAGISQVTADKQAIKSNISSLDGMEESYKVGTTTLVDVLNQQQKLFLARTTYATDRYAFVNNILALKQAAGTLSFDDLRAINAWLTDAERTAVSNRSSSRDRDIVLVKTKKKTLA